MPDIEIIGLPELTEAHIFSAPTYGYNLPVAMGEVEIIYVAEGTLHFERDGSRYACEQNDIACVLRDERVMVSADGFHEHHTVCFKLPYRRCPRGEGVTLPDVIRQDSYSEPHRLIDEIIRLHTLYPDRRNMIMGLYLQLLDEINEVALDNDGRRRDVASLYVYKAKEYIYKNLARPITQREIAKRLNITPEYFSSIFKAACGVTPMRFINRLKLSKIRMLMAREGMKLYEAAECYGFTDPNYVSKLYKKLFGQNITDSITVKFCESEVDELEDKQHPARDDI